MTIQQASHMAIVNSLRYDGFVHVTGLPKRNMNDERLWLPKKLWGKKSSDGLGAYVRVLDNGEVWLRFGNARDRELEQKHEALLGPEIFDFAELGRPPIFWDIPVFIHGLQSSMLAARVANPYDDFQGSHRADPAIYVRREDKATKKKL